MAITYGGYRVIATGATPGEFFSFITAFLLAYEPAKRLARLNIELNSGLVGVRMLFEMLDSAAERAASTTTSRRWRRRRRASNSTTCDFAYRADESVLRGMTFTAEPGKMTALVGPSGGGKSTVFNLLLRFYEPERGTIAIGGQDITAVSRRSLRRHVAYVGQDVFLFRGTHPREHRLRQAGRRARTRSWPPPRPPTRTTSSWLSRAATIRRSASTACNCPAGSAQRVAIARALIKNAPIILLDEATAALDSESELQVREAMEHLFQGRTTLAIAHRLHTVAHADCIHVVEDGRVGRVGPARRIAAQRRALRLVLPAAAQGAGDARAGRRAGGPLSAPR